MNATTSNILDRIKSLVDPLDFDFHTCFRQHSLYLREMYANKHNNHKQMTVIPVKVVPYKKFKEFVEDKVDHIRDNFLNLLMLPESAKILWFLHCSPAKASQSILTELCPSLAAISQIVRAGPNVYKLSGWMIHVLVGYSIVTDYIPKGQLPSTIDWPSEVQTFIKNTMQPMYESLDAEDRIILHVGMLGHDIGVAIDITNHETHGVCLVKTYLKELNINRKTLKQQYKNLSFQDFLWAVKNIVRFHTFITRAGVEYSKDRSATDIADLLQSASTISWRMSFLQKKLARILFLIAVGDLIAVDDTLLNERKVKEMMKGYEMVESALNGNLCIVDHTQEGFDRFTAFLGDKNQVSRARLEQLISSFGYSAFDFLNKFCKIQELNFALSLTRYLPSTDTTVLLFLIIFCFIDENLGYATDSYAKICVVFDHSLDANILTSYLAAFNEKHSLSKLTCSTGKHSYMLGDMEFMISKNTSRNIVYIRGVNG